jgi:hypothetical protein
MENDEVKYEVNVSSPPVETAAAVSKRLGVPTLRLYQLRVVGLGNILSLSPPHVQNLLPTLYQTALLFLYRLSSILRGNPIEDSKATQIRRETNPVGEEVS